MVRVVLSLTNQGGHMLVVHRVIDDLTLPTRLDHAAIAQEAELVRYRGLGYSGQQGKIVNAERPFPERIQHSCSCGIGERLKRLDDEQKQIVWRDRRARLGDGVRMEWGGWWTMVRHDRAVIYEYLLIF
jgi:hypothetical protein